MDQAALKAEPEDVITTKMEIGEAPQAEQQAAPPAVVVTPPTTGNVARECSLSTTAAPILPLHASTHLALSASPFGRTVERSALAPAAAAPNATKNTPLGGTPSSTGFMQRSHVPPSQPGAGLNPVWRQQSQPGMHSKSTNQLNAPQGGILLDNRAGPLVIPSAGSASTLSSGILPPGRSGPTIGLANPGSYPARPVVPANNRFSSTSNPAAPNLGEPAAATGQGHLNVSNRKVVVQGVAQTP